jgi:hypothetical protein
MTRDGDTRLEISTLTPLAGRQVDRRDGLGGLLEFRPVVEAGTRVYFSHF